MLRAVLDKALGAFRLEARLEAAPGTTLVLVGESGSGKTTALRLLAGLDRPDRGRIAVGDEVWFDAERDAFTPASRRSVGYVAQDYALFPHLDVFENVAFGLRALGRPGAEVRTRTGEALAMVGANEWARRKPSELSGGQQQRVALARALALRPRLLLLDEPLSALDPRTRRAVRSDLVGMLEGLPCVSVFVTHSPLEALAFGDTIAALEDGRVAQLGTRDDLLLRPRSAYVGAFLGVNLFRGQLAEADGLVQLVMEDGAIVIGDPPAQPSDGTERGSGFARVSPRDITLSREAPATSARNVFAGEVVEIAPEPPHGERVRVALATRPGLVAEVTRQAVAELGLRPGLRVYASFKSSGVTTYA